MDLFDIAVARKLSSGGGGGGGSSDFSTAEVVVQITDGLVITAPYICEGEELLDTFISESDTYNIIIPNGSGTVAVLIDSGIVHNTPVVSGDIEYANNSFLITGNGTITIS